MQFAEGLSDRQAAGAVRGRIDWKYVLTLELTDPGFDPSVLSEFRTRLLAGDAEHLLDVLLTALQDQGLLKTRGKQRTDSMHILAAIRTLNRLELMGETMRFALNRLAVVAVQAEPAVKGLRQVWVQQYYGPDDPPRWRMAPDIAPPAQVIHSPYDLDARSSIKRGLAWAGYKLPVTETCDAAAHHYARRNDTRNHVRRSSSRTCACSISR